MKEYPKVPRHDFDTVPEDFFGEGEVYVTEKTDGGNFRFTVYEEQFEDEYPEVLTKKDHPLNRFDALPSDGDIVFGTKGVIRGIASEDISRFNGELHRAIRKLRQIDVESVRRLQKESGPITFFAENMAMHTLDYGYSESPPPSLIGFDICLHRETDSLNRPDNMYNQLFEGFIEFPDMVEMFQQVGITPVATVGDRLTDVSELTINPNEYDFPTSAYADVIVEGVVFRKPNQKYRVKLLRPEFQELNRKKWGLSESQAENGNEVFVARYCTTNRVNKTLNKMVVDEGRELSMSVIEDLWRRVYADIWEEEWRSIKQANFYFNPSEIQPLVASICRGVVERRVKNAELNESDPMKTFNNEG